MPLFRLSGRKVCERVKSKGFSWKGKHMQARVLPGAPRNLPAGAPTGLFVGVLTSAKLDKSAVKRNRMRRRCREALRVSLAPSSNEVGLPPTQLLLMPRSSSLSAPFDEILVDAERLISSLRPRGRSEVQT